MLLPLFHDAVQTLCNNILKNIQQQIKEAQNGWEQNIEQAENRLEQKIKQARADSKVENVQTCESPQSWDSTTLWQSPQWDAECNLRSMSSYSESDEWDHPKFQEGDSIFYIPLELHFNNYSYLSSMEIRVLISKYCHFWMVWTLILRWVILCYPVRIWI